MLTPRIINNETRLIVDKETTNNRIENIYLDPQEALWAAEKAYEKHRAQNPEERLLIKIKITSDRYICQGPFEVKVPNIVIEPKEKGGEVTIEQQ